MQSNFFAFILLVIDAKTKKKEELMKAANYKT